MSKIQIKNDNKYNPITVNDKEFLQKIGEFIKCELKEVNNKTTDYGKGITLIFSGLDLKDKTVSMFINTDVPQKYVAERLIKMGIEDTELIEPFFKKLIGKIFYVKLGLNQKSNKNGITYLNIKDFEIANSEKVNEKNETKAVKKCPLCGLNIEIERYNEHILNHP